MAQRAWAIAALFSASFLWAGGVWAQTGMESIVPQLSGTTADHSKFEVLRKPFASGPEVTQACLSCHTEASDQVMHTVHWQWEYTQPETGQILGKSNVINSFCGNVAGNEARCTSCHAGYGWTDVRQPAPDDPTQVDCLACHDTSGQYAKQDNQAGNPPLDPVTPGAKTITGALAWPVNLSEAAQSVGMPTNENCGNCHFYGGGGDNVKHGDLSSVLFDPPLAVDVHMSSDGANMTCVDCHVTEDHVINGSRYDTNVSDPHADTRAPGAASDVAACDSCHTATPHGNSVVGLKLNDHTDRVACESCHIPAFARGGVATKTLWDWSTAGRLTAEGKPITENGYTQGNGVERGLYLSTKGDFAWGENVVPYYAWFDGNVSYSQPDEAINPSARVEINSLHGDAGDAASRIFPFKRMEGRQAYDTISNRLAFNLVYGPKSDTAFWTNFDWAKSLQAGADYVGDDYSGSYGFIDTYMYWPITHMVAPARDALDCVECHKSDGRMAMIAGVYVPAGGMGLGGKLGILIFVLGALGVVGHAALRMVGVARRKNKGAKHG